jgi:hypothetical protein
MQQQAASRLLSDIRRAPDLFPYQEETVRGLLQEITSLSQGVQERLRDTERDAEGRPRHRVLNEVQKCFLRRYKRCLVVYHSARCDRVENLRWNTGAVLPAAKRENMHSSEVDYFKAYSGLVSKYLDSCKLDLTAVRGRQTARSHQPPSSHSSHCLTPFPCPCPLPPMRCCCLRRASTPPSWTGWQCRPSLTVAWCRLPLAPGMSTRARRTS